MIGLRSFALLAIPAALLASACSSDSSLGSDRAKDLPTSGNSNAGSSGSGNSSSSSGNGSGSSGSSGAATGSSGAGNGSGFGGTGGAEPCEEFQCLRAIECVETCGGPVLKASCCPCDPGSFDNIQCGAGGGGGGGGGGGAPDLDELNTDCPADDACSEGLTPVTFYGVAGEAGPEFCWCTIPCDDDPNVCPETTTCTATGDGPGTVCFAN
jgi:hypothetical protein